MEGVLGWSVGCRMATRSFCVCASDVSYLCALDMGRISGIEDISRSTRPLVHPPTPLKDAHLEHVQQRRLAGIIKAQEEELRMLVKEAERGEHIPDWIAPSVSLPSPL